MRAYPEERPLPPDPESAAEEHVTLWSFREDVVIERSPDGGLVFFTRWGEVTVECPVQAIAESLHRMTLGPVALAHIDGLDLGALREVLKRFPGCVVRSLALHSSPMPLLSATPIAPVGLLELPALDARRPVRLSHFAFTREDHGELRLESPLSHHHITLHRRAVTAVVDALSKPTTCADIAKVLTLAQPLVVEIVSYLVATGIAVTGDRETGQASPRFAEDHDQRLLNWAPHELLFHTRSRLGRHDDPVGAVYNNLHRVAPLPVVKPVPAGRRFPLHRPDLTTAAANDMSLTQAMEQRRSVREFAEEGPSIEQLGELLFRAARVREQSEVPGPGDVRYDVSRRPYPTTGALYELELYLTVERCAGLPRGIYHYDPLEHALTLINERSGQVDELLDGATVLTGGTRRPPVLITMTTRMGRLSWVYSGISYATTLKHVGVLQQTLYLVATAMGLAPCALALGDGEVATEAFGLDWPAEVSVGEFVVGSPRDAAGAGTPAVRGT